MNPIAFGSRMTGRQDDVISSGSVLDDEYCNTETVILNDSEDNSEGERCAHASMGITEPKSWGIAPSSQFLLSQYRT